MPSESSNPAPTADADAPVRGSCWVFFAYDIGFSVDLATASRRLTTGAQVKLGHTARRAPSWLQYEPAPVRTPQPGLSTSLAGAPVEAQVEVTLYDFGAVSVGYRVPLDTTAAGLASLSAAVFSSEALLNDSRDRVAAMLTALDGCVTRPGLGELVEDYTVFCLEDWGPERDAGAFVSRNGERIARALLAETGPLSPAQVSDSLASRISFGPSDLAVIEWQGAVVLDRDPADTLAVLEHANVELLEMRLLDQRLDRLLEESYDGLARLSRFHLWHPWLGRRTQRRLAILRADSAVMFEGVNNAIKLVGDQFLARVYRLAAAKFHLPQWDTSILRKLQTAQEIYAMINDTRSARRMEVLELIIVLLIAVEIVMPWLGLKP